MSARPNETDLPAILIMDAEVLARNAVAAYLRECGYEVVEVSDPQDAKAFLESSDRSVDIAILASASSDLATVLGFSKWLRNHYPSTRTLVASNVEKEAKIAADVCEEGPHLRRPYEPQALVDWIKRLRA